MFIAHRSNHSRHHSRTDGNETRSIVKLRTPRRTPAVAALGTVVVLLLAGCSTNDSLAEQYRNGDGKNYVAGDGSITEIASKDRGEPIEFVGKLDTGGSISSSDLTGKVTVVNFWYAGCAPCRAEAPDLQSLWEKNKNENVAFLGVNVRDQLSTAIAFSKEYGITYPSVLDARTGSLQLAFSGTVAPNAVPTTLVLDQQGRVASRILGRIPDAGILDTLIASTIAEQQ